MMRATLCGVSTRSIPSLRESEAARESRSSISRLWQEKSAALVEQVQDSDLSDFNLVVLMLDAVILSDGLVATVALGINTDGQKRILGFRVGSSENQQVCEDLLGHLSCRGLKVHSKTSAVSSLGWFTGFEKCSLVALSQGLDSEMSGP